MGEASSGRTEHPTTDADFLTEVEPAPAGVGLAPGAEAPARQRTPGRTLEPEALRQAFRRHAAGVAVVTLAGPAGPVGFTATSVVSLSAAPPLLSLSLSATSSCAPAMMAAETLVVHLLSADHEDIARRFATRGVDRFAPPLSWRTLPTGEPVLSDVAVWLRARISHRIAAGESYLVIAEVTDSQIRRADEPLLYHDGRYGTISAMPTAGDTPGSDPAPEG